MKEELCQCECLHTDKIKEVKEKMENEDTLYEVSELFKVFGDSTRTNIIAALFNGELCVCDLGNLLNMTKSAISHQLRVLRVAHVVKYRKVGKEVFYSIADNHVYKIFKMAIEHIKE